MDKVSIIMPAYNAENTIKNTIESILNQNYDNYEIIVVDDGSTDNTQNIVKNIDNSKIKYFKLETNKGVSNARNFGIEKATGNYIMFIDSDDLYLDTMIEKMVNGIKESDWVICRI